MMKKKIILLAVLCTAAFAGLSAQTRVHSRPGAYCRSGAHYQGEFNVGYGVGVGTYGIDRYVIETVHGVRVNPVFFIGAGIGFHGYTSRDKNYSGSNVVPVFVNLKGYMPSRSSKVVPYLSVDLGYSWVIQEKIPLHNGLDTWEEKMSGFLITPSIGICIAHCATISFGYQSQRLSIPSATGSVSFDAFLIKAGVQF